jgi:protein involved in polysaccharide export with SLBB domain
MIYPRLCLLAAVSLLGLFLLSSRAAAQGKGSSSQDLEQLMQQKEEEEAELQKLPGAEMPGMDEEAVSGRFRLPKGEEVERLRISQDRQVDPATYIVGPGDLLQLYIWGELDHPFSLPVDPEGYVTIPTVGAFPVANKTLAEVKAHLIAAVQKEKYPGAKVTLNLTSMRFFTVYLTGAVLREGSFVVSPVTRVSDLIDRGGGYLDDLTGRTIEETIEGTKFTRKRQFQPQPTARRSLQLIHADGSADRVDLEMFRATGDVRFNPYIRMGDVVHVPYRQHEVFVYGSVNLEGIQEYLPGDTVGILLTLAGGVSGNAPLEIAEIWRFRADGTTTDILPLLDPGSGRVTAADIGDIALQSEDMLFIRSRSDWQQTPTVHLHGEVKYRGRYRIHQGQTRLREIIEQAGGFTEQAALAQARVLRSKYRALKDPEYERLQALRLVSGLADMSPEDRAYLKTKGREERGRLAVDFERLYVQGDESQNIQLEGGDVIFVPEKRRTVSLSGQVRKPGLIDFGEGRRVAFYLSQAGGYSWNANKGGARLIRARTGVREPLDKNLLVEAGDEIWIPEKEFRDWWAFTQSTMRTLAETLTIVILVRTL